MPFLPCVPFPFVREFSCGFPLFSPSAARGAPYPPRCRDRAYLRCEHMARSAPILSSRSSNPSPQRGTPLGMIFPDFGLTDASLVVGLERFAPLLNGFSPLFFFLLAGSVSTLIFYLCSLSWLVRFVYFPLLLFFVFSIFVSIYTPAP